MSDKDNIQENYSLIGLNQIGSNRPIVVVAVIVIAIIVTATIIVIYNSFQINVAERMKQFGLLRSIGATKKQIKRIVFREATILLMISIPIGLLISIGTIYLLQWILELFLKENTILSIVSIDIDILIISSIITVIAVYISSFLPANYVGNISPLVAISSRSIIKKDVIKKRKSKLLNKIFNFKVSMAIKNIRRNPKRCNVMILSVVVSSTLFITFTTLVQDFIKLKGTTSEYQNIDLEIGTGFTEDKNIDTISLLDKIKKLDNIERIYLKYPVIYGNTKISNDEKIKEAGNIYDKLEGSSGEYISTQINVYNNTALEMAKKYVINGNIDIDKMNAQNGVVLISNGRARDNITNKRYAGRLTTHKVGDEIVLKDTDNKEYKVKIMAIIENNIFEREVPRNAISLMTTDEVAKNLTKTNSGITSIGIDLKDSSLHLKSYEEINRILQDYLDFNVVDCVDVNETEKGSILLIQVLVYGFIFVITLISSINIVNTITMNITLRRKELSVLKSIGMSQKDLKKMIMYEGLFYGLTGGIIGCIAGCAFTYIIYDVLSEIVGIEWRIPIQLCIITILVSILISFLSALLPMKKIEKDNVIEAIREG